MIAKLAEVPLEPAALGRMTPEQLQAMCGKSSGKVKASSFEAMAPIIAQWIADNSDEKRFARAEEEIAREEGYLG